MRKLWIGSLARIVAMLRGEFACGSFIGCSSDDDVSPQAAKSAGGVSRPHADERTTCASRSMASLRGRRGAAPLNSRPGFQDEAERQVLLYRDFARAVFQPPG
jgi:hypothetical protein